MGKKVENVIDQDFNLKKDLFLKNIDSDMHFVSNYLGNSIKFDWVDEVEKACPFIDHIVRNPKLTLVQDEILVSTERAKRIMSDSIKDLAKQCSALDKMLKLDKVSASGLAKALTAVAEGRIGIEEINL